MAPILEEIESTIAQDLQLNIEIPSYVDDILICVLDTEGKMEMKKGLGEVDTVVNRVAAKWNLPLEKEKLEEIVFNPGGRGSGRKKKRAETERVQWLGIIIDENLEFDHHRKSRIEKVRKLLGALSGIGNSQWGISPGSWRQLYTGMVRVIALWGAELGWRGQKEWRKQFKS